MLSVRCVASEQAWSGNVEKTDRANRTQSSNETRLDQLDQEAEMSASGRVPCGPKGKSRVASTSREEPTPSPLAFDQEAYDSANPYRLCEACDGDGWIYDTDICEVKALIGTSRRCKECGGSGLAKK